MKLKRFISALIVFTMVMTCAVCVSADATYNVTTVYEVGSNGAYSGNITLNAAIAGATPDTFVSYLLVKPVTVGEGEEATTSYEVQADGSNILHIDQATVNASGNATFDSAKAAFADYEGGKVKFVSSGSDTFTAKESDIGDTGKYLRSIDKVSKNQAHVMIVDLGDNGANTSMYYVTEDNELVDITTSTNYSDDRFDYKDGKPAFEVPKYMAGEELKTGRKFVPVEGVKAWIVDFKNETTRTTKNVAVSVSRTSSSATGVANKAQKFTIYQNELKNAEGTVTRKPINLAVNGLYKDDVTDGKFGTVDIVAGAIIGVDKTQGTTAAGEEKPSAYVSIDAAPIYSTVDFGYGARQSVTFLATKKVDEEIALKITAYPNGTLSFDNVIAEAGEPVELGIYENMFDLTKTDNRFGIQLVDSADATDYLDADKYDLEATPCVKDATTGEWVELEKMGTHYFTIARTTAKEASAE